MDNQHKTDIITLVKNRWDFSRDKVLLRCLDYNRHWDNYYKKPKDIPFNKKKNKVFWKVGKEIDLL
jgi:hypothetical protein